MLTHGEALNGSSLYLCTTPSATLGTPRSLLLWVETKSTPRPELSSQADLVMTQLSQQVHPLPAVTCGCCCALVSFAGIGEPCPRNVFRFNTSETNRSNSGPRSGVQSPPAPSVRTSRKKVEIAIPGQWTHFQLDASLLIPNRRAKQRLTTEHLILSRQTDLGPLIFFDRSHRTTQLMTDHRNLK